MWACLINEIEKFIFFCGWDIMFGRRRYSYQTVFIRVIYSSYYPHHPHNISNTEDENSMKTITTQRVVSRCFIHAWNYMLHLLSSLICWMQKDVTRISWCIYLFLWLKTFRGQHELRTYLLWNAHRQHYKAKWSTNDSWNSSLNIFSWNCIEIFELLIYRIQMVYKNKRSIICNCKIIK